MTFAGDVPQSPPPGRWVAAGALEQANVEDGLSAAAVRNGVVAHDGERPAWAAIRSGLSAGLQDAIDLSVDEQPPKEN